MCSNTQLLQPWFEDIHSKLPLLKKIEQFEKFHYSAGCCRASTNFKGEPVLKRWVIFLM